MLQITNFTLNVSILAANLTSLIFALKMIEMPSEITTRENNRMDYFLALLADWLKIVLSADYHPLASEVILAFMYIFILHILFFL